MKTLAGMDHQQPRPTIAKTGKENRNPIMAARSTDNHPGNAQIKRLGSLMSILVLGLTSILIGCAANLNQQSGSTASIGPQDPSQNGKNGHTRTVKIALLLPLGGFNKTAVIAKSMKQAAEMALFERNDPAIQLIVKDDHGTTDGARLAAQQAISGGAQIILGPLFSKAVVGAAPVARSANIPIVSFSNDTKVAGHGVFLMSYLPGQEVERITNYALSHGKRRFAALIPDTVYGHAVEKTFRNVVSRAGGQIVALERYPTKANGMLDPAKRVFEIIQESNNLGAPIDALFLPGGQDTLPSLGPLIAYSGLDKTTIQLLGTGGWEFPNIGRDQAFVGGWYPSPDPRGWQTFSGRFAKNFGQAPPRLASLAYDAVNMAISLSRNAPGRRFTPAAISHPSGFQGIDGPFRFNQNGLSMRGLAILAVKKFGSQVIDPAPRTLSQMSSGASAKASSYQKSPKKVSSPFGASLFSPN